MRGSSISDGGCACYICAQVTTPGSARGGDLVIVATFAAYSEAEARVHQPKVVLVDAQTRVRAALV